MGTFNYDKRLSEQPDYCVHEESDNEEQTYNEWKDEQVRLRYDHNAYWRQRYLELLYEFADANDSLIDKVVSLRNENRRLKKENWQLKQSRKRRR